MCIENCPEMSVHSAVSGSKLLTSFPETHHGIGHCDPAHWYLMDRIAGRPSCMVNVAKGTPISSLELIGHAGISEVSAQLSGLPFMQCIVKGKSLIARMPKTCMKGRWKWYNDVRMESPSRSCFRLHWPRIAPLDL
jgi:hypothetical protein